MGANRQHKKKEYYDLVAFIKNKRQKIGYATITEKGAFYIKADDLMDNTKLGQLMKKGLYIQKRKVLQSQPIEPSPPKREKLDAAFNAQ